MKNLDKLFTLLGTPSDARDFELLHEIKLLKVELAKKEVAFQQCETDKKVANNHLKSTLREIQDQNKKVLEFKDNQLKQISDSMTSSMCWIDQNYVYRYVNYRYEEWFGKTSEELLGKSGQELAPLLFEKFKPIYDHVMTGETMDYTLDTLLPHNGERRLFKNTYVPAYDILGNQIGLYVYSSDVTENQLKTEALEASRIELKHKSDQLEEYVESNIQLEQFAHIAAHDMKAPLRTIASFTGIMEMKLGPTLSEKEKEYLKYIKEGTVSLSHMVTDLLDYSKIKSDGIKLQDCEARDLLDCVIRYLDKNINDKGAKLIIGNMPKYIRADRSKIYQVFQNIISNAIKFSDGGNSPIIKIKASETAEHHVFSISDNGIGIPVEKRTDIFHPFKQLNTKQKFDGTGLGLSICKRIINDHNGTITIEESQLGGSRFIFTIGKNLLAST